MERRFHVYDLEGVLGPTVIRFVDHHVSTLLAWDIIVFFYRNPDVRVALEDLSARLGRRPGELEPEIGALCRGGILACDDDVIRYAPEEELCDEVGGFVAACQDRGKRLALIALVLQRMSKTTPADR